MFTICDPLRENLALPTNIDFALEMIIAMKVGFQQNCAFYIGSTKSSRITIHFKHMFSCCVYI